MTLIERLEYLSNGVNGQLIVLGGMSKHLNGFRSEEPKGMTDISVTSDVTGSLESMGQRGNIIGGTTFSEPVKDQFVLRTEDYLFDVFVQDEPTDYTMVGSLKVLTPQSDLDLHLNMSGSLQTELLHNKIQSLKELYGL